MVRVALQSIRMCFIMRRNCSFHTLGAFLLTCSWCDNVLKKSCEYSVNSYFHFYYILLHYFSSIIVITTVFFKLFFFLFTLDTRKISQFLYNFDKSIWYLMALQGKWKKMNYLMICINRCHWATYAITFTRYITSSQFC